VKPIWLKDALIGLSITLLIWGLAEIGLRIYVNSVLKPPHGVFKEPWKVPDAELEWKLKPNYQNEARGIYINSQGFKGEELLEKEGKIYRIVALGDSTTFGVGQGYPQILQQLLNQFKSQDCASKFEVVNAGVEGYNSEQISLHFQRDVLPLKPDMILIYAGWNDLYGTDPENKDNQVRADSTFNRLLEYSFVLKAATKIVYEFILPNFEIITAERRQLYATFVPDEFLTNYQRIVLLARQNNIQVVSLTLPSPLGAEDAAQYEALFHYPHYTQDRQLLTTLWRSYNRAIVENARSQDIPLIDLAQAIELLSGESQYFFDTLHFYEEGYRIVATIILNNLANRNFLPCQTVLD
jgi:lysophospholipase L1-like esterase